MNWKKVVVKGNVSIADMVHDNFKSLTSNYSL